ncbi:MAG: hypothetical protein JWO31_342 [Phycisphaerales bacterium]|nr:hypothetical protein [Phycisphaerales bacterium]
MSTRILRTCVMVALAGGAAATVGCANKTEGERTIENANKQEQAGLMIKRGELMVQDGKAMEARGEEAKRQGDNDGGDRMVANGRAKEAEGRALIDSGRKMKP